MIRDDLPRTAVLLMRQNGEAIAHLSNNLKERGYEIRTNGENDQSRSWLMDTMKDIDELVKKLQGMQDEILDAIDEDDANKAMENPFRELMTRRAE